MEIPPHLLNEHYDDRYFDVVSALAEADYIHLDGNRISERLTHKPEASEELHLGELGFGAGRNLVALIRLLEKSALSHRSIHFHSVELHPITVERMATILDAFRLEAGSAVEKVLQSYALLDINTPRWQTVPIVTTFGKLTLHLWIGEALEMVHALKEPCEGWFLDGHGPKKNPAMWRAELLLAVGEKTALNGTCTTFTVAGEVKRNLSAAGFTIEKRTGMGGKKSVLLAQKVKTGSVD